MRAHDPVGVPSSLRREWLVLLLLVLGGLVVRLWALGSKGLAYDEAATALMARATPAEILYFHWDAAFEHPPFWQLTMVGWSRLAGQSEFALRFLPALMGALAVPGTWLWLRLMWPGAAGLRLLAAGLVATSPILVLYSQEARMYTVVLVLALASLMAVVALVRQPRAWVTVAFVVVNWLMVGYHYYSLLLVGAEGLFFILAAFHGRVSPRRWLLWLGLCVLSMIPITLWMAFAPGFRETFTIITAGIGGTGGPTPAGFFDDLWRDLSFGIIRWRPEQAILGYLLLPLMALGLGALLWRERGSAATRWSWLVALAALAPLLISVALFRSLAARYILFIVPALYVFAAAGIVALWRWHPALGVAGAMLPLVVAAAGLSYYFGPYHKSEYREMAAYLRAHREPADAVMLLAPRQHLLAKYYLPADWSFYTAPQIDLPPYWPLTAPRVVPEEMDGQIQDYLRQHPVLWLVLTSQNEVDPGEFVPKYLTAVAYKEDCDKWLDVDLCHFASPHAVKPYAENTPDVLFNGELRLARAALSRVDDPVRGRNYLLAELDWLAERKPTVDYRVTLRLLDGAGNVVAQRDEFPIGTLLPPTTWNAGDAKPGYMALPLGADTAPGTYQVVAGVYAPGDGALFGELVPLGSLEIR